MSLRHTLLGFLYLSPLTGYEIKTHMDNSTQFFWHASLSQIYPELNKLEQEGLLQSEVYPQQGKPDKRIYTITQTGRAALLGWLGEPIDHLPATKDPPLLKLFFSGVLDKQTVLAQLRNQLELHRAQLAHYERETAAYAAQIIAVTGLVREGVMWKLVEQFGEELERTHIRWLENAIMTVEREL